MSKNPPADLFTFTKEIFDGKLYFFVVDTMDNEINISEINQKPLCPSLF